jgi:hypothetical protein
MGGMLVCPPVALLFGVILDRFIEGLTVTSHP